MTPIDSSILAVDILFVYWKFANAGIWFILMNCKNYHLP